MTEPTFDLIVGSIGRHARLERLLTSLVVQDYERFRVIIIEQRDESGTRALVARIVPAGSFECIVTTSPTGLSRARNVGMSLATADILAFPDDDCWYDTDTLSLAARKLASPTPEILIGRQITADGKAVIPTPDLPSHLDRHNVWTMAMSSSIFVRRSIAERAGLFDERLGVGSGTPWQSGEETDWVLRMLGLGATGQFDPELVVRHPTPDETAGRMSPATGLGYGRGMGAVMREHNYPRSALARAVVRPLVGSVIAALSGEPELSRFRLAASRGRLQGWRRGLSG